MIDFSDQREPHCCIQPHKEVQQGEKQFSRKQPSAEVVLQFGLDSLISVIFGLCSRNPAVYHQQTEAGCEQIPSYLNRSIIELQISL